MLGHDALNFIATVIMLDKHWLGFSGRWRRGMLGHDGLIASPITSICNKLQTDRKGLFFQCFVLKQQRLFFAADYLSDRDRDVATILAAVRLGRFTPAPVEQQGDGLNARCWRRILGAGDACQDLDAHFGVTTRQRG
jgi:hypothetical protein